MPETLSGSKPDKVAGDKIEVPTTRENTQPVEAPAAREKVEAPTTADGKADIGTERQREERIATIDAKREEELAGLNAARTRLGLAPTDTSVAIAALDHERTALAGQQRDERTENQTASQRRSTPEVDPRASLSPASPRSEGVHAGEQREGDKHRQSETGNALQVFGEGTEGSRITPEIRHYFQEILGPEETMRRLHEMDAELEAKAREYAGLSDYFEPTRQRLREARANLVPELRQLIASGNLNALVSRFTRYDPALRKAADDADTRWRKEQSEALRQEQDMSRFDPRWGRAFGPEPPSEEMYFRKSFDDTERSIRDARGIPEAGPKGEESRNDAGSEAEREIRDKIAKIPDELVNLKTLLSTSPKTRRMLVDDDSLLKATPDALQRWNSYLDDPLGMKKKS